MNADIRPIIKDFLTYVNIITVHFWVLIKTDSGVLYVKDIIQSLSDWWKKCLFR
jgi:hypothetical protein